MNKFVQACREKIVENEQFPIVDAVYLFGSSLCSNQPNDIDIVLIYKDGKRIREIENTKIKMSNILSAAFYGLDIHFVTLSKTELKQTKFLDKVKFLRIK